MINFYLHQYNVMDSVQGIIAPHKYKSEITKKMGQQEIYLSAWERDKEKIIKKYIIKLKEIYKTDDSFLIFAPATQTRIFIDDIIEGITDEFPNAINLTDIFSKKENVSFGNAKFEEYTITQLAEFINVDQEVLKSIDKTITKVFIVDDVYASGKSLELTKHLIKEHINKSFKIKSGVILKIDK